MFSTALERCFVLRRAKYACLCEEIGTMDMDFDWFLLHFGPPWRLKKYKPPPIHPPSNTPPSRGVLKQYIPWGCIGRLPVYRGPWMHNLAVPAETVMSLTRRSRALKLLQLHHRILLTWLTDFSWYSYSYTPDSWHSWLVIPRGFVSQDFVFAGLRKSGLRIPGLRIVRTSYCQDFVSRGFVSRGFVLSGLRIVNTSYSQNFVFSTLRILITSYSQHFIFS